MQIYIIWTHRFCEQHWVFPLLQHSSHCFCRQDLVCVGRTYSKSITCPSPRLISISNLISSHSLGNRYNFESVGIHIKENCYIVCLCACAHMCVRTCMPTYTCTSLWCEEYYICHVTVVRWQLYKCSEMKLCGLDLTYTLTISLIPKQKETAIKKRGKNIIIILNAD